ncbi:hypothetical protein CFOL_v3_35338 [Cephalotus follicularis]|uniref:Uncharacterized protein n=1 Tax=Cephalotus follicularis TaxID=3775 RepID=A0A1Q3DI20_CEPFO|nr:hypothetical protein CFOL_v3_35338 [Cephalotus follicularis]
MCPYTARVWEEVLRMCNVERMALPWDDEIRWMLAHSKGSKFPETVRKLALAATVYHVWLERNRRTFSNLFLPHQDLVRRVRRDVVGKLSTRNNAQQCEHHHSICENWGITVEDGIAPVVHGP